MPRYVGPAPARAAMHHDPIAKTTVPDVTVPVDDALVVLSTRRQAQTVRRVADRLRLAGSAAPT